MANRFAVVGAGRQGIAAVYDLAIFGKADEVLIVDSDLIIAEAAAQRLNKLLDRGIVVPVKADASNPDALVKSLKGINSIISAVPYSYNLGLTELAIQIGANMCDLGGNTDIVRKQLAMDEKAKDAGVSIIPDCGMGPGMNVSLATYAMSLLDNPREVYIWDGVLPQNPEPPWNYALTFNVGGLTNEYSGHAYFLKKGKVVEVGCFEGYELLEFPKPLGKLEAFVTSGGLSTMPWTFEGKLARLENRTLRYPGHWAMFRAFAQLGLLDKEKVSVDGSEVSPRDVFHALLEKRIVQSKVRDVGIIRIKCVGEKDGKPAEVMVELIDHFDEKSGFTAMQRLTGWHASIMAILATEGRIRKGTVPVELAAPGENIVKEAERRGFKIEERIDSGQDSKKLF
jgi:lysine 6-dehydrogenase